MWKKLKTFLLRPPMGRRWLLEALIYLAWARMQKDRPFTDIAARLGAPMVETPTADAPERVPLLRNVSRAVRMMSRHTPWESKCLVMAIAAMKMLERRGVESTLYLGTAKDDAGRMIAHAWLRSGSCYVTGFEEMPKFTTVAMFGNRPQGEGGRPDGQPAGLHKEAT